MGKQFTSDYQPKKHTGPRMTTILKQLLNMETKFPNPITGEIIDGPIIIGVCLKLIQKAIQDEDLGAIKEIFERIDGKVMQVLEHSGKVDRGETKIIIIHSNGKQDAEKDRLISQTIPREIPLE